MEGTAVDLEINFANDYARDINAPVFHPHVCLVHYNEMGAIRHTLNRYNAYAIFTQHNFPIKLKYGVGEYKILSRFIHLQRDNYYE